jgi:hypothetical protein
MTDDKSFGDWLIPGAAVAEKHLPGQHKQTTHGNRGGKAGSGDTGGKAGGGKADDTKRLRVGARADFGSYGKAWVTGKKGNYVLVSKKKPKPSDYENPNMSGAIHQSDFVKNIEVDEEFHAPSRSTYFDEMDGGKKPEKPKKDPAGKKDPKSVPPSKRAYGDILGKRDPDDPSISAGEHKALEKAALESDDGEIVASAWTHSLGAYEKTNGRIPDSLVYHYADMYNRKGITKPLKPNKNGVIDVEIERGRRHVFNPRTRQAVDIITTKVPDKKGGLREAVNLRMFTEEQSRSSKKPVFNDADSKDGIIDKSIAEDMVTVHLANPSPTSKVTSPPDKPWGNI